MIYLDHAATTAVYPSVLSVMQPFYYTNYYNPSSSYGQGMDNHKRIDQVRSQLLHAIHSETGNIYFTSGGTEADNWAILCGAMARKKKGHHIITSQIEHHAVLHTCEHLEKQGYEVTYLAPDAQGIISPETLEHAIRPDTILVSLMYANNETGAIQPVEEYGKITRPRDILFHCDGVQAFGHIPIHVDTEQIDALSVSGHKFGGPKGIGFLYVRKDCELPALLHGGAQETGHRAGTENTPAILGMGEAAKISIQQLNLSQSYCIQLRDTFTNNILTQIPGSRLNGPLYQRLPGHINICFPGISSQELLVMLELRSILASGGSACNAHSHAPSHVLQAMGLSPEDASCSIRFTLGTDNSMHQIDYVLLQLKECIHRIQKLATGQTEENDL